MEAPSSPIRPITGCVRADVEASDLLETLKGSVAASGRSSLGGAGGATSASRQANRLSEQLQASFREQQELINENAALHVRIETLERELTEGRRTWQGARDLEVLVRSKETEMDKLGAFWGERLAAEQARSAELDGEVDTLKSVNVSLTQQLADVAEERKVHQSAVRQKESELEKAAARIASLEQSCASHNPRAPTSPVSSGRKATVAILPSTEEGAVTVAGHGSDGGMVSVELETLRGQLEAANMRAEAMAARAEAKEALAAEAVKRAERMSSDNKEIMRNLRGVEGSADRLRAVEESSKVLEARVAELTADRKALESDRDVNAKMVATLEQRLASESRELSAARLALESKNRQCESAVRELDSRVRRDVGTEEHTEKLRVELREAQSQLVVARQQAAEMTARTALLENQVQKRGEEAESSRWRCEEAMRKLTSVVDTLSNSQRERKQLLENLKAVEEAAQKGDTSLLKQIQLCREQQELSEQRAARAEQSLSRLQLEAEAIKSRQVFAESEAVERSERLRAARLQLEAAVKRQQEAEGVAMSEAAGRRKQGVEAKERLAQARKQLHECEMALVKAEQEQDGARWAVSSAQELGMRLKMEVQRSEALEWQLQELRGQLGRMQGMEGELEKARREEELVQEELAAVRQEASMASQEARDVRERFGDAQSALQAARKRLQSMQHKIDTLLQERQRLHAALQSHEEVVRAMAHELDHTRKVQKILNERDKGREQQLSGMGMEISKLKLLKQVAADSVALRS